MTLLLVINKEDLVSDRWLLVFVFFEASSTGIDAVDKKECQDCSSSCCKVVSYLLVVSLIVQITYTLSFVLTMAMQFFSSLTFIL